MNANRRKRHDAFSFSLGGQSLRSPVCIMPAITEDRINAAIARRLADGSCRYPENQPDTGEELSSFWDRLWQKALRRAA